MTVLRLSNIVSLLKIMIFGVCLFIFADSVSYKKYYVARYFSVGEILSKFTAP